MKKMLRLLYAQIELAQIDGLIMRPSRPRPAISPKARMGRVGLLQVVHDFEHA